MHRRGRGRLSAAARQKITALQQDDESSSSDSAAPLNTPQDSVSLVAAAVVAAAERNAKQAPVPTSTSELEEAAIESIIESAGTKVTDDDHPRTSTQTPSSTATERREVVRERKSRYIEKLVVQAERRKLETEAVVERRLAKQREQEDELFPEKERFVTAAYKRRLEERDAVQRDDGTPIAIEKHGTRPRGVSSLEPANSEDRGRAPVATTHAALPELRTSSDGSHAPTTTASRVKDDPAPHAKRRRRWGPAPAASNVEPPLEKRAEDTRKPLRGLRRNDADAIEAYRQRYFARRDARLQAKARVAVATPD